MLLIIDNYDSFTYNIAQYFQMLGQDVKVVRNDDMTLEDIFDMNPSHIVLSPGPGRPEQAGITLDVIDKFTGKYPILGICLGHQAIALHHGAQVTQADQIMHGKTSKITHSGQGIFRDLMNPLEVTRYHSLLIANGTLSDDFTITAHTKDGEIMGIEHKQHCLYGVQFHPESILTEQGLKLLQNFLTHETA
jgi:anthranilate synthase/aminodeoxychorismate synthase-like glutamine amidotransferase